MDINWIPLKNIEDNRGKMSVLEFGDLDFKINRFYCLSDLNAVPRGFHAHKKLKQIMFCLSGSCELLLDDGHEKITLSISSLGNGLLIDKMIWHELSHFSSDCLVLMLASDQYDETDYIRNYNDFRVSVNDTQPC